MFRHQFEKRSSRYVIESPLPRFAFIREHCYASWSAAELSVFSSIMALDAQPGQFAIQGGSIYRFRAGEI